MSWLSNLFKQPAAAPTTVSSMQNTESRGENETYHHWGLRMCAVGNGSPAMLSPFLHKVYLDLYTAQAGDEDTQKIEKAKKQSEISQKENEIANLHLQIQNSKNKQQDQKDKIEEIKTQIADLESKAYEINKDAKVKMRIGLCILVPLTFYLFLFYSSTFYSAFFKNWSEGGDLMSAMFDGQALSHAYADGIMELPFCLFAPVIFLGLGFSLHYMSKQQGRLKYFKMAAIVCVTFVFDILLAYTIGKHLFEMEVLMGTKPLGNTYGFADAMVDPNLWIVIFCGFIVYIIWGIVFDMTMSAYDKLDLNKVMKQKLQMDMLTLHNNIAVEQKLEHGINQQVTALNNEIAQLEAELNDKVIINKAIIKAEMMNFLTGWIAQMNVLQMSTSQQQQTTNIFNQVIETLLK